MDILADYLAEKSRPSPIEPVPPIDPRDRSHQLLRLMYNQHCLFTMRFAPSTAAYQTAIVDLDPVAGYLVLDALVPASGNALAVPHAIVLLQTRLRGIDIKFASEITSRGEHDGLPYYQIPYPKNIEYPQRRQQYRVKIPFNRGVQLRYFPAGGGYIGGELRDLSPSGFGARLLSGDFNCVRSTDMRQGHGEIDLAEGLTLKTAVAICHVVPANGRNAMRIGACFSELDRSAEHMLERVCAGFDRARLRAD